MTLSERVCARVLSACTDSPARDALVLAAHVWQPLPVHSDPLRAALQAAIGTTYRLEAVEEAPQAWLLIEAARSSCRVAWAIQARLLERDGVAWATPGGER